MIDIIKNIIINFLWLIFILIGMILLTYGLYDFFKTLFLLINYNIIS